MKYVCLVYGEEKDLYAMSPERLAKLDADSLAYDKSVEQSGRLIIAQALQSVKTAKTVRRRKGKRLITDGPFAETKEQLLGFVMIEAGDIRRGAGDCRRHPAGRNRHDRGQGDLQRAGVLAIILFCVRLNQISSAGATFAR